MKILVILICSINLTFALDVTPIRKGQAAPDNGFFVDQENMKGFRKINEENKLLKKENLELEELSFVNNKIEKNYQDRLDFASKEITKEQIKGNLRGVWGFVLGVAATSLAAFAAAKSID